MTDGQPATEQWLPTLLTKTPQAGFELALKLARNAVKATQPDAAVRSSLRPAYDHDAGQLIAASHVVGTYFHTVANANDFWRSSSAV